MPDPSVPRDMERIFGPRRFHASGRTVSRSVRPPARSRGAAGVATIGFASAIALVGIVGIVAYGRLDPRVSTGTASGGNSAWIALQDPALPTIAPSLRPEPPTIRYSHRHAGTAMSRRPGLSRGSRVPVTGNGGTAPDDSLLRREYDDDAAITRRLNNRALDAIEISKSSSVAGTIP